jgi:hypothetical protein
MISTLFLMSMSAQAATVTPTHTQQVLYESLRVRHAPPSCADLDALSLDPVLDLVWLVENATQPPWVGMRAAQCLLLAHPHESQAQFESWLSTDGHRGLAILMTQKVDVLPLDVATSLTRAAMAGPDRAEVKPRLAISTRPEIRALASD